MAATLVHLSASFPRRGRWARWPGLEGEKARRCEFTVRGMPPPYHACFCLGTVHAYPAAHVRSPSPLAPAPSNFTGPPTCVERRTAAKKKIRKETHTSSSACTESNMRAREAWRTHTCAHAQICASIHACVYSLTYMTLDKKTKDVQEDAEAQAVQGADSVCVCVCVSKWGRRWCGRGSE